MAQRLQKLNLIFNDLLYGKTPSGSLTSQGSLIHIPALIFYLPLPSASDVGSCELRLPFSISHPQDPSYEATPGENLTQIFMKKTSNLVQNSPLKGLNSSLIFKVGFLSSLSYKFYPPPPSRIEVEGGTGAQIQDKTSNQQILDDPYLILVQLDPPSPIQLFPEHHSSHTH